jgi:hypothetical protein
MPGSFASKVGRPGRAAVPATVDEVDDASLDSFPASDPPGWSGLRVGPPIHEAPAPPASPREG